MRRIMLTALALLLVAPSVGLAQQRPRLHITAVRVGFPGGHIDEDTGLEHAFKAGCFAPVFIDIQAGRDGLKGTEGRIDVVVETPDIDDVLTNYTVTVPLPELGPNGQFTVSTFTKVPSTTPDVKVYLRYDGQPLGQPYVKQQNGKDSGQALYLTVGGRLAGLRQALDEKSNLNANQNNPNFQPLRESVAYADQLHHLPTQWFGYQGIDLVILTTGKREYMEKLVEDRRRREALVEWVLRGGHLLVSVGRNHEAVAAIPELAAILPVRVVKTEPIARMRMSWDDGPRSQILPVLDNVAMDVAVLETREGARKPVVLLKEFGTKGFQGGHDLAVRCEAGLGTVTVVAFDIDQRPFTDWKDEKTPSTVQADFWKRLVGYAWPRDTVTHRYRDEQNNVVMNPGMDQNHTQLLSQLYSYLENFEDVPVISFGWVALFIFIYILVVGPLDYLFLKKVVKRLELTWITFPTVVLTVSAVAYFTAYWLKGKDLRIRKIDLVDIDLASPHQQVVGHTWFTLFSPRIQHYTLGIEPGSDWAAPDANSTPLVSWMGRPDTDRYNMRTRGQTLFRRSYDYEPNAAGLHGVPIQVWSTKSFTASWQAALAKQRPLVKAELRHVNNAERNREDVAGTLTWLPDNASAPGLELSEAYLLYNKRVLQLKLEPGKAVDVNTAREAGTEFGTWFRNTPMQLGQPNPTQRNPYYYGAINFTNLDYIMRGTLFFADLQQNNQLLAGNSGLRMLDQSQRLGRKDDEAILIGRLASQKGEADAINGQPASASRLWLGALPVPGTSRPALEGKLQQDTYVRVFLPVHSSKD